MILWIRWIQGNLFRKNSIVHLGIDQSWTLDLTDEPKIIQSKRNSVHSSQAYPFPNTSHGIFHFVSGVLLDEMFQIGSVWIKRNLMNVVTQHMKVCWFSVLSWSTLVEETNFPLHANFWIYFIRGMTVLSSIGCVISLHYLTQYKLLPKHQKYLNSSFNHY